MAVERLIFLKMKIKVKKIHPEAKVPIFAQAGDAGLDMFSVDDLTINPGERSEIHTGVAILLPLGYVGLLWDKGGPSIGYGMKVLGGVFDSNYTGEYVLCLANLSDKPYVIKKGQKVAQLLIQKVEMPEIVETEELPETNRGDGRKGSTGLF